MELSAELQSLLSLKSARADFFNAVVKYSEEEMAKEEKSKTPSSTQLQKLRDPHTELIAELFFVMSELAMNRSSELRSYIERHNADMLKHLNSPIRAEFRKVKGNLVRSEYVQIGILVTRIHEAIVPQGQIDMLCMWNDRERLILDQRTIARLLVETMSFETCRTLLKTLTELGFLERKVLNNCVSISSNGVLEELYGRYLGQVHGSITKIETTS